MEYAELKIRIEHRDGDGYSVFASGPTGEATGQFRLPFEQLELENFVLRVGRARRGVRRVESPEMRLVSDFGKRLFDSLFQSRIRDIYRSSYDVEGMEQKGLRITLSLTGAPELLDVPWEYLCDDPNFLSLSTSTPIVRYLDLPRARRPLQVTFPLRILGMVSSPSDCPELDVEREKAKLETALKPLIDARSVEITWLEDATLRSLQRLLRQGPFHIFHYIGHGAYDPELEDGVLMLETETETGRRVTGRELGTLLLDHRSLRLAVLNACEGARSSRDDPFAGVATSLVEREIPAVIAMQFEITDRAAIIFAEEFYWALADGYPVDGALAEARKAIFADNNDIEWGTPVLFMRVPDGRIFDVPPPAERPHEPLAVKRERAGGEPVALSPDGDGAAPPVVKEDVTPARVRGLTRRVPQHWWLAGVVAVVAATAAILAVTLVGGSGHEKRTPGGHSGGAKERWSAVEPSAPVFGGPGHQEMKGIAPLGTRGGAVAVGLARQSSSFPTVAASWSFDGSHWKRLHGFLQGKLEDVASDGRHVVAVGTAGPVEASDKPTQDAVVWMLDGNQPRSVCGAACGDGAAGGSNFGQTMFAVVARRLGGFVGVGYDTQREGPGLFAFDAAVWRSRNGTTWERVPPQNALRGPGNQAMKGITETSSGQLVAVGKNAGRAAVWTSATGDRWISVHSPDFAEPGYGLELNDVVEYRGELFAVGRDGYPDGTYNRAAVWVRPTGGGEWTRVAPNSFPRDGGIMRRVAVGPSGLVAVGRSNANGREVAAVWVSKNGRTWTRAESTSFAGVGDTAMNGVAAVSGPGLLAVGTGPTAGSSAGAQQDARVWRRR